MAEGGENFLPPDDWWDYSDALTEEESKALLSQISCEDEEEGGQKRKEKQDNPRRDINHKKIFAIPLRPRSFGPADTACGTPSDEKPHRIRLLSWNIDGLDPDDLRARTHGVCKSIMRDKPHVVFLQEVVEESLEILKTELPMYYFIAPCLHTYFVAILLRKDVSNFNRLWIIPLPTIMGRYILSVKCTIKGENFFLMTAHLESTRVCARNRRRQLKKAFSVMDQLDSGCTVIFGGDMNLRDHEVIQIGGLPANIQDIWEITGKRKDAESTWDLRYNDNRRFSNGGKPWFHFDRIYMKNSVPIVVEPVYFELIGFDRLPFCHRFCSDHWGLLTHFDILSKLPKQVNRK